MNADLIVASGPEPKRIRIDRADAVIQELMKDARIQNKDLADKAGLAQSTCLGRVKALRDAGVIKGFHAEVDLQALGFEVAAMIAVRVAQHARSHMLDLARQLRALPEVQNVFLLAGDRDFLVHVVCRSPQELRDFIAAEIASNPSHAHTQTSLVFDHLVGSW